MASLDVVKMGLSSAFGAGHRELALLYNRPAEILLHSSLVRLIISRAKHHNGSCISFQKLPVLVQHLPAQTYLRSSVTA